MTGTADERPNTPEAYGVSDGVAAAKQALRQQARAARRALGASRQDLSARACAHALAYLATRPVANVAAYWALGDELDPAPILYGAREMGWQVGLPVTCGRGQPLVFRSWNPDMALVPAGFGTKVPPASAPEMEPDIVLVPLLALDRHGNRLGYGAGFYDRTLERLRAKNNDLEALGLAFACQVVERVPTDLGDQTLDGMITEVELTWFHSGSAASG